MWIEGESEGICPVRARETAAAADGKQFLEAELAMLSSLATGDSVTQHLEPYYFAAMCSALQVEPPPSNFELVTNEDGTKKYVWKAAAADA